MTRKVNVTEKMRRANRENAAKNKPKSLEEHDEVHQFILKGLAAYETPAKVYRSATIQFGEDNVPGVKTIYTIARQKAQLIREIREELELDIPILNPVVRLKMAQEIADLAIEGIEVFTPRGAYTKYDLPAGISALKYVDDHVNRGNKESDMDESTIIKQIVRETFEQMRADHPEKDISEIVGKMMKELPASAQPYIEELNGPVA
jgi:hypothetical protein